MATKEKKGFYYGWVVVAAAFIVLMCNAGTSIYGFSLFVTPITTTYGFSTTAFILCMTITTIVSALLSPIVGAYMGKHGLKKTALTGAVLFFIGFTILSFANILPVFYVGYFFVGLGASFTGPIIGSTVASRWFDKYRGTATGITSAGIGIGSMVLVPIISRIMATFGHSKTYLFMGILDLVVISLVAVVFLKDFPSEKGLFPDGAAAPAEGSKPIALTGLDSKAAMGTSAFWLIGLGIMCYSFAQFGILQTQNPYLQSLTFDPAFAARVIAIVGMVGSISKLLFGVLTDTISLKAATLIGFVLQGAGAFILSRFTPATTTSSVYLYSVIFGLGLGCWQPILSGHLSKSFGVKYFPAIFGSVFLIKAVGDTLGPIFASLVNDNSGSYAPAYIVFAIVSVVSVVFFMIYKTPKIPEAPPEPETKVQG